jgi:hypothetical protein
MRSPFLDLLGSVIDHIPKPDPQVRRARLMGRLVARRTRLRIEVAADPSDTDKVARLAGVEAEISILSKAVEEWSKAGGEE